MASGSTHGQEATLPESSFHERENMSRTSSLAQEGYSSLVLEAHAKKSLWSPGPAWVAIAGALAAGWNASNGDIFLRILVLAFLADPVWGGMWHIAHRWPGAPKEHEVSFWAGWRLPYFRQDSPARKLSTWLSPLHISDAYASGVFPSFLLLLLLGVILSIALGKAAILATLAVAFLSPIAAALHGKKAIHAAVLSLAQFLTPWALAAWMFGGSRETWILGGMWTFAHFLMTGAGVGTWQRGIVLAGQSILVGWFAWMHHPVAAALMVIAFLPIWTQDDAQDRGGWLARSGPWWLVALLISAIAVGR